MVLIFGENQGICSGNFLRESRHNFSRQDDVDSPEGCLKLYLLSNSNLGMGQKRQNRQNPRYLGTCSHPQAGGLFHSCVVFLTCKVYRIP